MKKLIIYTFPLFLLFATQVIKAQVLYTENFDNLTLGELSTDPTGITPGKGGWYVKKAKPNNPAPCEIVAEAGRGNVLSIGGNINDVTQGNTSTVTQKSINTLWNGRTQGNNILKLEYDVYTVSTSVSTDKIGGIVRLGTATGHKYTVSNFMDNIVAGKPSAVNASLQTAYYTPSGAQYIYLGANNTPEYVNFPYNNWVSVQIFVDYKYEAGNVTGGKLYVYIPALNILKAAIFTHNEIIEILHLHAGGTGNLPVAVKYDNVKLTALNTLPNYLGVEDFLAEKFNLYPNPATNIVNITNAENMQVSQVVIYDINGKQLSTQSFKNETEIKLNVENLSSGTYMLHVQTAQGTAVKKLVKK